MNILFPLLLLSFFSFSLPHNPPNPHSSYSKSFSIHNLIKKPIHTSIPYSKHFPFHSSYSLDSYTTYSTPHPINHPNISSPSTHNPSSLSLKIQEISQNSKKIIIKINSEFYLLYNLKFNYILINFY